MIFALGADLCGVASVERFQQAPPGFHPSDIYNKTQSVIVFALRQPSEPMFAQSCIPYTHMASIMTEKVDFLTLDIALVLEKAGIKGVPIPSDDPYEYWDQENRTGRAILSLKHAAQLAGLGKIGKNTLLVNRDYGNMIRLGALLIDTALEQDSLADYEVCPPKCHRCLDSCPTQALNGTTVLQKRCRPLSTFVNEKGYVLQKCFECRKVCPQAFGVRTPASSVQVTENRE